MLADGRLRCRPAGIGVERPREHFETSRDHLDHLAWRCGAIESRRPGLDGGADGSALSDLFACVSPTAC
jgi:hypothetical protein